MGTNLSREEIRPVYHQYIACPVRVAGSCLQTFREQEFEFALDLNGISSLLNCDISQASCIIQSFSENPSIPVVNSLALLCAIICLSGENKSKLDDHISLIFDVFDFEEKGTISIDELTILFFSLRQGLHALLLTNVEHDDESSSEQLSKLVYQSLEKKLTSDISKADFIRWNRSCLAKIDPSHDTLKSILAFLRDQSLPDSRPTSSTGAIRLNIDFPDFHPLSKSNILTNDLFEKLSHKRTDLTNCSLDYVLQSEIGFDFEKSAFLCVAGDAECYTGCFRPLFKSLLSRIRQQDAFGLLDDVQTITSEEVHSNLDDSGHLFVFRVASKRNCTRFPFPNSAKWSVDASGLRTTRDMFSRTIKSASKQLGLSYSRVLSKRIGGDVMLGMYDRQLLPDDSQLDVWQERIQRDDKVDIHFVGEKIVVWTFWNDHFDIILSVDDMENIGSHLNTYEGFVQLLETELKGMDNGVAHDAEFGYLTRCPSHCGSGFQLSLTAKSDGSDMNEIQSKMAESEVECQDLEGFGLKFTHQMLAIDDKLPAKSQSLITKMERAVTKPKRTVERSTYKNDDAEKRSSSPFAASNVHASFEDVSSQPIASPLTSSNETKSTIESPHVASNVHASFEDVSSQPIASPLTSSNETKSDLVSVVVSDSQRLDADAYDDSSFESHSSVVVDSGQDGASYVNDFGSVEGNKLEQSEDYIEEFE